MDSSRISDHVEQTTEQQQDRGDGEIATTRSEPSDSPSAADSFIEQFSLTIGKTRVYDEHSDEYHWLWKASDDNGTECISGTIFDAVMGVIEDVSGGEV